jgi:hypothetical protein
MFHKCKRRQMAGMDVEPVRTIIIFDGAEELGNREIRRLPGLKVMWEVAPESMYHSPVGGGVRVMVLKLLVRACWSHEPVLDMGVHGTGGCCCWNVDGCDGIRGNDGTPKPGAGGPM